MYFASSNYLYVLLAILTVKVTRTVGVCKVGHAKKRLFSDTVVNHTIVGPIISYIETKTQDECETECHLAVPDQCYMFNYHPSSKVCELLYKDRAAEYKVKKKPGSTFKTQKCEPRTCAVGTAHHCVALGNQNNTLCLNFTGRIIKANKDPVCIGAKDDKFGTFFAPADGKIKTFKLVHLSGGVSSKGGPGGVPGNWGDSSNTGIDLHITDTQNSRIAPPIGYTLDNTHGIMRYSVPDVTAMSPELVFPEISPLLAVTKGKEFRIWLGQDLSDIKDSDNQGQTCADVYVFFTD